jgi:NAD+ diphosphatase
VTHQPTLPLIFIEADRVWIRRLPQGVSCLFGDLEPQPDACVEQVTDGHTAPARVVDGSPQPPPDGAEAVGLRAFFDLADEAAYGQAARAYQLLHWRRTHRFCSCCGQPMHRHAVERAMHCAACGYLSYPRINPVVIVRITRGNEILLARRATGATGFFSLVAGFVEAGETLEQAVHREVAEEVGVQLANVRYFSSQPWPYPNNLMVGFTADFAGGTIQPDGAEIAEAGWFTADRLPTLPGRMSISRRLIDDFVHTFGAKR